MRMTTRRLVLREFVHGDWPDVIAYQCTARHLQFYPWADRSEADVQDFVQRLLDQQAEEPRRKFQRALMGYAALRTARG